MEQFVDKIHYTTRIAEQAVSTAVKLYGARFSYTALRSSP